MAAGQCVHALELEATFGAQTELIGSNWRSLGRPFVVVARLNLIGECLYVDIFIVGTCRKGGGGGGGGGKRERERKVGC